MTLLDQLNVAYLARHEAKEAAFWAAKMRLAAYRPGDLEAREIALKAFAGDVSATGRVEAALAAPGLDATERTGLEGWRRFFLCNRIPDAGAAAAQTEVIEREGELERARTALVVGYREPRTGTFVAATASRLGGLIPDESG